MVNRGIGRQLLTIKNPIIDANNNRLSEDESYCLSFPNYLPLIESSVPDNEDFNDVLTNHPGREELPNRESAVLLNPRSVGSNSPPQWADFDPS